MSGATADPRLIQPRNAPRKPIRLSWSDPRLRAIVWQVLILGLVAAVIWYLAFNTSTNLAARHIATGFAFLGRIAGIPIGEHIIDYDPAINTYGRALLVGVLNTLKVWIIGIIGCTILGTLVGVARLSNNWLLARLMAVYIEINRNIPLLLQLLFWYVILQGLPSAKQALNPVPGVFISNRGIKVPLLDIEPAHWWALAAFVLGWIGTAAWARVARKRQDATGVRPKIWPVGLAMMVGLPVLVWAVLGAPFHIDMPSLRGFNFVGGGTISPEFGALEIGLIVYTSAYVAETVRSGIQAVHAGQTEAAGALGLSRGMILRQIVLPQAIRVIIPPMTSEYLSLAKNSSLAVAIGYQDVVSVTNTVLNQTGQAIEGIGFIMAVYLTISVSISLLMNWYNAHIALVER